MFDDTDDKEMTVTIKKCPVSSLTYWFCSCCSNYALTLTTTEGRSSSPYSSWRRALKSPIKSFVIFGPQLQ